MSGRGRRAGAAGTAGGSAGFAVGSRARRGCCVFRRFELPWRRKPIWSPGEDAAGGFSGAATLTGGGGGATLMGTPAGTSWAAPVAPTGGWMREATRTAGGEMGAPFRIPAPGCAGGGARPGVRCGGERGDAAPRSVLAGATSREGRERAISRRRTGVARTDAVAKFLQNEAEKKLKIRRRGASGGRAHHREVVHDAPEDSSRPRECSSDRRRRPRAIFDW